MRHVLIFLFMSLVMGAATAAPLTITTSSPLPEAFVGRTYSVTLTATGGIPPYKWKATGVPNGLTWTPKGIISGVPKKSGTHIITVTVTDSAKTTATTTMGVK